MSCNHPLPDHQPQPPQAADGAPVQTVTVRPGEVQVVPVVEEQVEIATMRRDEGAVRVRKQLESRVETVELPGWTERAHIERVAVDQPADAVRAPHREGDVWVVPVYEERWVTVKQLYLREELRIAAVREPQLRQESVTLQREQVRIERQDPVTGQWRAATPEETAAALGATRPGGPPPEDGP